MKHVIAMLLSMLVFSNAYAEGDANTAIADKEWRSYIEPMLPIGEKLATQLGDPQDPQLRQELYKLIFSQLSSGYFAAMYADAQHPDFWPIFNQAYNVFGPNPDNSYYSTPIDGKGVYKISGYRGTVRIVDFSIASGDLFVKGSGGLGPAYANYDLDKLNIKKDGSFEVILSGERPPGWKGNWWKLDERATYILIRQICNDPLREVDGRYAIERLDRAAIKPRPTAAEIAERLPRIAQWAENWTDMEMKWIKRYLNNAPMNAVHVHSLTSGGGVATQSYIEGQFELQPDEALIYETEVPKQCRYWNVQITDMLMVAVDYMNRQGNLNGHFSRLDKDRKFRAVISAADPGVPNWLDTAGYAKGGIIGRWTDCSSAPTPVITKVKFADIRKHLPADTAVVTVEQRDAAIRERRKGAQLRRRW